jgi:hypothetical protein
MVALPPEAMPKLRGNKSLSQGPFEALSFLSTVEMHQLHVQEYVALWREPLNCKFSLHFPCGPFQDRLLGADDEPTQSGRPTRKVKIRHDWAETLGVSKTGASKPVRGATRGSSAFQAYRQPKVDTR